MGPTERAAVATIREWRRAGAHVDALVSSQLRGAAADVDRALEDYAGGASLYLVTQARIVLGRLTEQYRPAVRATDAVDDALAELLASADAS